MEILNSSQPIYVPPRYPYLTPSHAAILEPVLQALYFPTIKLLSQGDYKTRTFGTTLQRIVGNHFGGTPELNLNENPSMNPVKKLIAQQKLFTTLWGQQVYKSQQSGFVFACFGDWSSYSVDASVGISSPVKEYRSQTDIPEECIVYQGILTSRALPARKRTTLAFTASGAIFHYGPKLDDIAKVKHALPPYEDLRDIVLNTQELISGIAQAYVLETQGEYFE